MGPGKLTWPHGQRVQVIGCGSAGQRTIRLLLQLGVPASAITGYDVRPVALPVYTDLSGTVAVEPDAIVFVCSPINRHLYHLSQVRDYAKAVYVEKSLCDVGESPMFIALHGASPRSVVGYNWRFHPAVKRAKAALRQRRSATAYAVVASDMRTWPGDSYGDPLLEFSHELDTMQFLFGPGAVTHVHMLPDHAGAVISLVHWTGAYSTVEMRWHASQYRRSLSINEDGWHFEWSSRSFSDPGVLLASDWTPDDMYRDTLWAFLGPVLKGDMPEGCTLDEGRRVVAWCEDARKRLEKL